MSGEQLFNFPPLDGGQPPIWDPNGPDGQLRDPTREGAKIGDLAQLPNPPHWGWVRGPDGTAFPDYMGQEPPPGALAAMVAVSESAASRAADDVQISDDLILLF